MTTITKGNYGATIHTRNDGEGFDVYFLYNMKSEPHGDVWERKTFKRESTAQKKIEAYFAFQGV